MGIICRLYLIAGFGFRHAFLAASVAILTAPFPKAANWSLK